MNTPRQDPSLPGVVETMDAAIDDMVERVIAAAEQYSDPVDQAESLEHALGRVYLLQQRIGQARSRKVAEALGTRSAADIAEQMGLTRQRVYQLVRGIDAQKI